MNPDVMASSFRMGESHTITAPLRQGLNDLWARLVIETRKRREALGNGSNFSKLVCLPKPTCSHFNLKTTISADGKPQSKQTFQKCLLNSYCTELP